MNQHVSRRSVVSAIPVGVIPTIGGATAALAYGGSDVPHDAGAAADPLLAAIANYRNSLGVFNAASFDDEAWDEQADALANIT